MALNGAHKKAWMTESLSDQELRMKCKTNQAHLSASQGNWSETFDTVIKTQKETNYSC